tara:strand:- start:1098 stop:1568 length:471 start_codon:yes stop_codon:yes gene_type:complete
MNYTKHLIECQCVLSIFKNKTKPIYHKFPVFSKIIDDNSIEEKYVMCENCNIIHHVTEICKSEIKWGNESLVSLINTKDDIKFNLNSNGFSILVDILEKNQCHISDWELSEFFIENKESGILVLNKKEIDNNIVVNLIEFNKGKFKLKKEISQRYL